ncbi:MAG: 30S ribosomal protein S13 [Kiritimatiellae bacterium]|nr:30S ribosomal protein S13 [Kiritimatiellia bacterium]
MPRLMGIDIPDNKRIEIALRYIHGIGPTRAAFILEQTKIDPAKRANTLSADEIRAIIAVIQANFHVEGDLRREVSQNIRRLVSIGSYRGTRHRKGLPVRGQRTRTNARTRKGAKHTVGAVRDKAERNAMKNAEK